jgi:hypothetical protein
MPVPLWNPRPVEDQTVTHNTPRSKKKQLHAGDTSNLIGEDPFFLTGEREKIINLNVAYRHRSGVLSNPFNAGHVGNLWVMDDFTWGDM